MKGHWRIRQPAEASPTIHNLARCGDVAHLVRALAWHARGTGFDSPHLHHFMRLNAFLARAGVASRRGGDELIKTGRVIVNGQIAKLNAQIDETDNVRLDAKIVRVQSLRYILLNKPAGIVTTLKDPQGRRKVADLIYVKERVVPVGRLDFDTSGILLLTNDGELAHRLMHPSFKIDKVYEATISGKTTEEILNKLSIGVKLEDGVTSPAKVKKLNEDKIQLTIHEGRKHQVKRMLAAVGLRVKKLHRSQFGQLKAGNLTLGQWRDLTELEIRSLKKHKRVY